ncbi:hypothetical protein EGW08_000993, partial [Elysia chlorotica]
GKDDVNKLRYNLEQERDQLKRELAGLGNLQGDHARLQEDHSQMRTAYDKLSLDYSQVLHSHKQVKTDYNNLQLKATELQGELNEAKENMSVADLEFQKLENKVDTVYQINERIENENQALLMQIKQLLNQNQDLLTQALNSKDHFAEEEKAYLEKLSDLRRQKERLEEKIMEHYKNRMSPKKKGLGALIARKARGIISRGPRRSKSRNNLHEGLDNSSQGSGSTEHINDGSRRLDKRTDNRRASSIEETPKLASQNRSLAKSSTALHSPFSENEKPVLRGAKSTENLHNAFSGDSHLLPGVGRPYTMEAGDGQGKRSTTPGLGRRTPGRASPGSEMLTLDQFLKEANKSPRSENGARRRTSNDSESRGSDNSNNSNSRRKSSGIHQTQPHLDLLDTASPSTSLLSPASSNFPHERSGSRMSGESGTGGGNDNSSLSSAGGGGNFTNDVFTSTPKPDIINRSSSSSSVIHTTPAFETSNASTNNSTPSSANSLRPSVEPGVGNGGGQYLSHKRLSGGDDWRSSSQESSPYASTTRMNIYAAPASSSSPRDPAGVPSSSSMPNSYTAPSLSSHLHNNHNHNHSLYPTQVQAGNLNVNNCNRKNNPNFERELPPAPTDPPPPIPAAERLDRLTMLASSSRDPPGHAQIGNHQAWSRSNREDEVVMRRPGPADFGRRTSQGPLDRHHSNNNNSNNNNNNNNNSGGGGLLPDQLQPPVPRSQPPLNVTPASSKQQKNEDNSVVSGHNPRRPPANLMPGQNNNNHLFHRARPASAMGPSPHIRGVISRPPGEGRPRLQQQQNQHQSQQGGGGYSNDRTGRVGALSSNPPPPPQNSNIHHNQSQQPERPKSVPPHMFIPSSIMGESGQGHQFHKKESPIPPPRRTKEDYDRPSRGSVREAPEGHEPPRDSRASGVSLLREPSRSSSRGPPSSVSSADSNSNTINNNNQQQVPSSFTHQHQQRFNNQNSLDTNRQNLGRSPSQPFSDQQQTYSNSSHGQFSGSTTNPSSRPANPRQFMPGPHPQPLAGPRPDSLNLAGPRGQGQVPPPLRSHSSMGQPVGPLPSGAVPYGRSTTPGPHPASRRDSAPLPQTHHPRDAQDRHLPDPGQRLPPPGAPMPRSGQASSVPSRQDSSPGEYASVGPNRSSRAGSLPKDVGPGGNARPDSRGYPQPHPASFSGSQQHFPERQALQPPQHQHQRSQPGPTPVINGSFAGHNSSEFHQNSTAVSSGPQPHPRQVQVPPQIRSQGRPAGSLQQHNTPPAAPPPSSSNNRQVGSPTSSLSSPLSEKAEQNVGGVAVSNKASPGVAPNGEERAEEKGPAKSTSSIWYEYGCV